jgi:hypothetical protein
MPLHINIFWKTWVISVCSKAGFCLLEVMSTLLAHKATQQHSVIWDGSCYVGCSYKVWIFWILVRPCAVISVLTRKVNITGLSLIGKASACNLPSYHSNEKKSRERLVTFIRPTQHFIDWRNQWIFPVLCSLYKRHRCCDDDLLFW